MDASRTGSPVGVTTEENQLAANQLFRVHGSQLERKQQNWASVENWYNECHIDLDLSVTYVPRLVHGLFKDDTDRTCNCVNS
jgi:hypothetical protein